ncbi:MAG: hypothetical protein CSB24_04375 [Deltaproteobacteria bacterium]|nr:MAG: hypothetical protein CSB24_04375 [Deltaproteobacteria bacterium]
MEQPNWRKRFMMRFSIQAKMLAVTVLVLFVGHIGAFIYGYFVSTSALIDKVAYCLKKEVVITEHFMESWFEHALGNVTAWGIIPALGDSIIETGYYGERARHEATVRMREIIDKYKQFNRAHVYDLEGRLIASSDDTEAKWQVGDRTYFKEASAGNPHISKLITSRYDGKQVVVLAAPIKRDGCIVGVVTGQVVIESVTEVLRNIEKIGQKSVIYLLDRKNKPIMSSQGKVSLEEQDKIADNELRGVLSFLQSNENEGIAGKDNFFRDNEYIYVASPMKYNGWKVVELNSVADIKQAEKIMLWKDLIGSTIAISIVTTILFIVYRVNIFSRLLNLHKNLELLEHGELETRVREDRGYDEISILFHAFNRTADKLQRLIESLSASREQFRLAVDGSYDGIWDWNLEKDYVYFSPRWYEQIGYNKDELEPLTFDNLKRLVHDEDRERVGGYVQAFREGKIRDKFDIEYRLFHKSGHIIWIHSRASIVIDDDGLPKRLVGAHTDTTEQHLISEQLLQAKEAAEASTHAKSDFLAKMSHEIRTPIGFITGLCHMMKDTGLNHKQSDYVAKIQDSSRLLLSIINDILDFSKIEAGKMEIDLQLFNIREMFKSITESFKVNVREKNLELKLYISPDVPDMLVSDPLRLNQIITNLVSNAIKFTDEGEIFIAVKCLRQHDESADLEISVKDTGIGMTVEEQARIFKAFAQADSSISRRYGGTGLGLVICSNLAKLLGGEITMESEPEQGTRFTLSLNMKTGFSSAEEQLTIIEDDGQESLGQQGIRPDARVLLVEDNEINVMIAESLISKLEITPHTAENGKEALKMVKENDYDLILMDIQMPIMDGYTATREIRSLPGEKYQQVPIIAMTANAMKHDVDNALSAGMNGHLSKPIEPDNFYRLMRKWLAD